MGIDALWLTQWPGASAETLVEMVFQAPRDAQSAHANEDHPDAGEDVQQG